MDRVIAVVWLAAKLGGLLCLLFFVWMVLVYMIRTFVQKIAKEKKQRKRSEEARELVNKAVEEINASRKKQGGA